MVEIFFHFAGLSLFYYFLIINSFYFLLILFSIPSIYKRFIEVNMESISDMVNSESLPEIAIIVPCYNLESLICKTLESLSHVEYPAKRIVVVNDGSKDKTLDVLKDYLGLYEVPDIFHPEKKFEKQRGIYRSKNYDNITVIDKENGGRAEALNYGIQSIVSQYFLVIDGDTLLEKNALLRMVRPFFSNANVLGQGGTIRILNGCTVDKGKITSIGIPSNYFAGVQVVEYLRSFLYGRLGWNYMGGNVIVSGAFGLFEREAAIRAGMYDKESIGEDFDLTIRLIKYHYDSGHKGGLPINFIPDPVAWTEVPSTYRTIRQQRARWHQGLCQTVFKMWRMFCNTKYSLTGLVAFPYMVFGELFEPVIEFFGILLILTGYFLGFYTGYDCLLIMLVAWGLTASLSLITVFMEMTTFRRYRSILQLGKLFLYSFFENFGFRQMYIWWRFIGMYRYYKGEYTW